MTGATDVHDAARLAALAERLFFIVGCGRSGTTLLQSSLLAHPDLTIPPETKFYDVYPGHPRRWPDPARTNDLDALVARVGADQARRGVVTDPDRLRALAAAAPRSWDGIFLALLAARAEHEGATRIGEKSPVHTHYVGHLAEAFPRATFIHVLRDPRAVVNSRIRAGFGTDLVGPNIDRWHRAAAMHRAFADRLGPARYLLVRYETFVTELEPTLRAVCALIGLEFRPEMLEPHKRRDAGFAERSSAWMANTRKPVFTSSIERWREELAPAHLGLIEHALGADMRELGYEPTGARVALPGLRLAASRAARWAEFRWRRLGRGLRRLRGGAPDDGAADETER